MTSPLWTLRPTRPNDTAFIYNSWLKSYRDSRAMAGVPNTTYYREMHDAITNLLKDERALTVVACDPADPNIVFGWAVGEKSKDGLILHYGYTKHPLRNFGIAKAMIKALETAVLGPVSYSIRTESSGLLLKSRDDVKFDPFAFYKHFGVKNV